MYTYDRLETLVLYFLKGLCIKFGKLNVLILFYQSGNIILSVFISACIYTSKHYK